MFIKQLLENYDLNILQDIAISGIALNSKLVVPDDLFFALAGRNFNASQFVNEAIANGAVAIVSDQIISNSLNVPNIILPDLKKKLAFIADTFYNFPAKNMSITGITGTNGKTSISYLLAYLLKQFEKKSAIIGTLGWGGLDNLQISNLTTPDPFQLFQILHSLQKNNTQEVTMEVSSIALDQYRVDAIKFDCAVLTNLQHDHLDYHVNMSNYAEAKEKLFLDLNVKSAIINIDDIFGKKLQLKLPNTMECISYGFSEYADLKIEDVRFKHDLTNVLINTPWGKFDFETNLLGQFNVYNLLAVLAALLVKGYKLVDVLPFVKKLPIISGRMQKITAKNGLMVIVDYAHTPDALKNVLQTIKQQFNKNIWCVFGCGGARDKDKRPIMGKYASELANHVIITSDNPRDEDPKNIAEDILRGVNKDSNYEVELDREKAIYTALSQAKEDDIVLIAGRGHEQTQKIGNYQIPFNDYNKVKIFLELNNKN